LGGCSLQEQGGALAQACYYEDRSAPIEFQYAWNAERDYYLLVSKLCGELGRLAFKNAGPEDKKGSSSGRQFETIREYCLWESAKKSVGMRSSTFRAF